MRSSALRYFVSLLSMLVSSGAVATEKEWSFGNIRYALCEGLGVAGSYSVDVGASLTHGKDGTTISKLHVTVDSAAFAAGKNPGFVGKLIIKDSAGKTLGNPVDLVDAWFDVLAAGGSTSVSKYLPPASRPPNRQTPQKAVVVPSAHQLFVFVSPIVSVDGSACPLGTTEQKLDL